MLGAMKLHNYFRSSASFRVRIALELKGLAYDYLPVLALDQVYGDVLVAQALELQRDAHAKGCGGAEVVVQLHGREG